MFEYKLLIASKPQEMEQYINQWAATEGWRVQSVHPPHTAASPGNKWYATLEREMLVLQWPPSPANDLAGYKVYWSKTPANGVQRTWILLIAVPKSVTSHAVPLALYNQPGVEYTFSVSAYDLAGNESKQTIIATWQR